jgi:acetyltransferase-like isoleucine patch superfamily enzyme
VTVATSTIIGDGCSLGCLKEARLAAVLSGQRAGAGSPVTIGERCLIFNQVILYEGVEIGDDCVVEDRVRLGYDVRVGARTRLVYGAYVCDRVSIGCDARVGGFVCDGVRIGDRSTVMGQLVHEYSRPHEPWWDVDEAPPVVGDDCVVGFGAIIVGGVRIGPRSYVVAGATITKDVPAEHVALGTNALVPMSEWRGARLQGLIASIASRAVTPSSVDGRWDVADER